MPRANLSQTTFTGGVLSPRVLGRLDMERYYTAIKEGSNVYAVPQGGLVRRPGTLDTAAAYANGNNTSILVPFVIGRDQAWMLEFAEQKIRVYNSDGTYSGIELTSPYIASTLGDLDWAQSDSTLYLFHPAWPIRILQRLSSTSWVIAEAPFTTKPFAEIGHKVTQQTTLSSAAVGTGVTATATGPIFLAADVGRAMVSGPGIAVITGYTSTTQVTVEVTRAFSSTGINPFIMESSPQTTCTPSAVGPVGDTITLTLGAAGWRDATYGSGTSVGSMVRINGGLCRITAVSSTTVADAKVVRVLSSTVAAPALAWSLEPSVWADEWGYPRTGTVYQQRLLVAGSTKFPRTLWGSRLAEPLDFELGTTDDLAFAFTIDSDESSAIAYVTSSPALMVLTQSGEYSVRHGVEKALTPTNVRIKQESNHGAAAVRPVDAAGETLFVQRAGRKIRSLGYRYDADAYSAPDITTLAEHLTKNKVRSMCWTQEPDPVLWVSLQDGTFLMAIIDRDQQPPLVGWFPCSTDGWVEWMASIPNGDQDQVWQLVRRSVNGSTVRRIERYDLNTTARNDANVPSGQTNSVYGMTVDGGSVFANSTAFTSVSVAHLAGNTVDVVADGLVMEQVTVPAGGTLTLPRAANKVQVGRHFQSYGRLLTPELGSQAGTAQGSSMRSGRITLRFLNTLGATVENEDGDAEQLPFQQFGATLLDQPPPLFTDLLDVSRLGWNRGYSELTIRQDLPLPMHLLAVTRRHTANEG